MMGCKNTYKAFRKVNSQILVGKPSIHGKFFITFAATAAAAFVAALDRIDSKTDRLCSYYPVLTPSGVICNSWDALSRAPNA